MYGSVWIYVQISSRHYYTYQIQKSEVLPRPSVNKNSRWQLLSTSVSEALHNVGIPAESSDVVDLSQGGSHFLFQMVSTKHSLGAHSSSRSSKLVRLYRLV